MVAPEDPHYTHTASFLDVTVIQGSVFSDMHAIRCKNQRAIVVAYPSLRRITRSSLERLRSASHRKKLGYESLLLFVMSATVDDLMNGATLAP